MRKLFVVLAVLLAAGCCSTGADLRRENEELKAQVKALQAQIDSTPRYPEIRARSSVEIGPAKKAEETPAAPIGLLGEMPRG